jgi:hypothetical protein
VHLEVIDDEHGRATFARVAWSKQALDACHRDRFLSFYHYSLTLNISLLAFVKNLAQLFLSSAETTEI